MQALSLILALVSLCCYGYVIFMMFQNAETVMGVVCLVGLCVFGLGGIVAFVYGWIKAQQWNIVPVMATWSGCIVVNIILGVIQAMQQN